MQECPEAERCSGSRSARPFSFSRSLCRKPGLKPGVREDCVPRKDSHSSCPNYRVAALVGDLATENDAVRLSRSQVPVKQITTGTLCHLEAAMVQGALEEWDLKQLDFLFIENVGNLVWPSCYDLGEHLRLVLISVTEGEDKPLKYPTIFNSADVAVVTKVDLAAAVEFSWKTAYDNIQAGRPGIPVLKVSAKTGEGIGEYLRFLAARLVELRQAAAV